MSTMDGKHVLAAHSLFTVVEFAFDWVKLVGVFPPALKGKYVEVTVPQWISMFQIVSTSKGDHQNRVDRAQQHHESLQMPTPSTHLNFLIMPAMQIKDTSASMKSKTNTEAGQWCPEI